MPSKFEVQITTAVTRVIQLPSGYECEYSYTSGKLTGMLILVVNKQVRHYMS